MLRRGVSELVAAAVLIAIVVAAMAIYMYYIYGQQRAAIRSFQEVIEGEEAGRRVAVSVIYARYESGSATTVSIYLYNYGSEAVSVREAYIEGLPARLAVLDAEGNVLEAIEPGKLCVVKATVDRSFSGRISVLLILENGQTIEVEAEESG